MMFLKRRRIAKRLYKQLLDELEPLNQKLKKEVGIPKNIAVLLWDALLFNPAIRMYVEGLNCYISRCYEASAIMCRDAIDSAIYLASAYIHTKNKTQFRPRDLSSQIKNSEWRWGELKKRALKLKLLTESDIGHIQKIRDKGNFSAHYAMRRDLSRRQWTTNEYLAVNQKWRKENETEIKQRLENLASMPMPVFRYYWKQGTIQEEALSILIETKDILEKLITNYFVSETTLYDFVDSKKDGSIAN